MTRRWIAVPVVATFVAYGWVSVEAYRSRTTDPVDEARAHIENGFEALNDSSREPAARLRAYRGELAAAEPLLHQALRAQPVQPDTLSVLAAVRWELDPPLTPDALSRHLKLIERAGQMGPDSAHVQRDLGELLLKMGRREEALRYLRRAVELEPGTAEEVVALLRSHRFELSDIVRIRPRDPNHLIALRHAFIEEGRLVDYTRLIEPILPRATARLLGVYGWAMLRTSGEARMQQQLDALGAFPDTKLEAQRLRQLSQAYLRLANPDAAIEHATAAVAMDPEHATLADNLGRVALGIGRPDAALEAFSLALTLEARKSNSSARARARYYRQIGQAEEMRNRMGPAYDAYRRALALDPDESVAVRRLREMNASAGVRSRGAEPAASTR